ncbi:putative helicase protein [Achromobacter phage AXY1]|nr:putative helicase protein [Achromobacter phage AXY1]
MTTMIGTRSCDSFIKRVAAKFERVEHVREDMHDYQDTGVDFIKLNPFCALWIDLGLGKTCTTLTAIRDLIASGEVHRVLVVGPIRVIKVGWPDEIAAWEHLAWLSHTVVRIDDKDPRLLKVARTARASAKANGMSERDANSAGDRAATMLKARLLRKLADRPTHITLVNREAVPWLMTQYKRDFPWDMIVIDESSSFKDHKSERVKAMLFARGLAVCKRFVELTATPTTEGYEGLFSQIGLIDYQERFGKFITHYRNEYFSYDHYKRKYNLLPEAEDKILAKIADITLVMKAEDYFDMEKPQMVPVKFRLSDAQQELYDSMERDRVVQLMNGREVEAKTAAELSQKLLQMSSGVLYERVEELDPKTGDLKPRNLVHNLHDHKIEELTRIIDGLDGEPVLVAYHWKSSLDRLKKAFPKGVELDKEGKLIKKWNDRKIPIMFVHPQSAGHGLNLQKGGHHLVLFDVIWSLELFLQLVGRLARQGQKNLVIVHILMAIGTLDEFVVKRILEKKDAQDAMFVRLKRLIAKMRGRDELVARLDAELEEL